MIRKLVFQTTNFNCVDNARRDKRDAVVRSGADADQTITVTNTVFRTTSSSDVKLRRRLSAVSLAARS